MIIQGETGSKKTSLLVDKYVDLVNAGVDCSKILVLVQNASKRTKFKNAVKAKLNRGAFSKLNIYTFFGLCYNFVLDYWPMAENTIKNPDTVFEPNMCSLEVSQYIFKKCIDKTKFSGYNSKMNLLHQLLRRYSLIVQNSLSDSEAEERTKVLKESFTDEARNAIGLYKAKTLSLRAFDYLRQVLIFSYLYKNVENPFEYVFLDDGDEITSACFEYLKYVKPTVKNFFIAHDKLGSSRLGYLSARITDFEDFLKEDSIDTENKKPEALALFENIKNGKLFKPSGMHFQSVIRRDEMISEVIERISELLKKGVKPSDIAIVTPCIDESLKYFLKDLKTDKFFLSGNEKLTQNPYVKGALTFLKILNSPLELVYALQSLSGVEYRSFCLKILKLSMAQALSCPDTAIVETFAKEVKNLPPSEQLYRICTNYLHDADEVSVFKLNQLIKQIKDFETIFGIKETKGYLFDQLEHTIISENPLSQEEIPENSIVIGTMQKMADNEIKAGYYFWLDISSSEWLKQDIGPLYNSWVFQKDWKKKDFEVSDNIELTLDKSARLLRKLYLCAKKYIYAYSSVYDAAGVENFGGINKFFIQESKNTKKSFKIVPRPDQKPVLEYKGGKLAVSAVAGSGKTTVMLALILKLLESGVSAENIFVLTFMESAARNFKERIKESFPHLNELPHISTIHGLALRILRENNNHAYIGLDEDFEIVDEQRRLEFLREVIFSLEMEASNIELYDRAISAFKNSPGSSIQNVKSPLFKKVFEGYSHLLAQNNSIDYDDLLLCALKLLKINTDVREHYGNLAKYIIEDEAQDSSSLQQELITILGGKHGNIIRCGDVNQSIMATFTNSDVVGFRRFIDENKNIKMDHSQRCSRDVYTLANSLIDEASATGVDAFLDVKMQPVEGKNPVWPDGADLKVFETQNDERAFIVQKLKSIFQEDPKATAAVLLRSNWSVADWAGYIESNSIKTVTRTDVLINNPVYELVLAVFNFILDPRDNVRVLKLFEIFKKHGFYKDDNGLEEYVKSSDEPFIIRDAQDFSVWWDLDYFIRRSFLSATELSLEIGDFYFKNSSAKANIILISLIINKIQRQVKTFEELAAKMNDAANKPNRFGIKFFDTETSDTLEGKVQIMTLHKSKGDEFDFVFVPEMSSDNINLGVDDVKLKKNTTFTESLKPVRRDDEELKKEIVRENYRLLYVAITRAKKALVLSCAKNYKVYSKMREVTPCEFLKERRG